MKLTNKEMAILKHVFLIAIDLCSKNGGDFELVLDEHGSDEDPLQAVKQLRSKIICLLQDGPICVANPSPHDEIIRHFAYEIGPVFDEDMFPDRFEPATLPPDVEAVAEQKVAEHTAMLKGSRRRRVEDYAYLIGADYAILDEGKVIGYVARVEYDGEKFDMQGGGGVTLYLNMNGSIISEIQFFGGLGR